MFGNRRILADPDAFIDSAAQVFGELAVDMPIDFCTGLIRVNRARAQDASAARPRTRASSKGGHATAHESVPAVIP